MGIPPTDYLGSEKTPREVAFNFLLECDPTPNKENLQWLIGLYKNQLISYTAGVHAHAELGGINGNFYEDLYTTVKSSLEIFAFLKKTNVLAENKRDINKYVNYQTLNEVVLPYTMMGDEGEDNVHTLDTKELRCIQNHQNFIEKNKEYDETIGRAELVFENKDWVIVITHDKEANVQFGKYTAWCTAGTRYGSMFDSYHGRGELFVLVKKGYGSKTAIKKDPSVRLQFHFEDQQYMDAPDRPISINDFLFDNPEVKDFFKKYITKVVLPKRQTKGKVNDDIQFLLKLGYGDQIIKMLKDSKPKVLDFSGNKMDYTLLSEIGDIDSLEKLDFSDCGLTDIPESIQNLKNLKYLKLRNNNIKTIPNWLNKLKSLTFLDLSSCGITNRLDLTGLSVLTDVVLDYNAKMSELPIGLESLTSLSRLTASNCDLRAVESAITSCKELFLIDIHGNKKLSKIPVNLSGMDNIIAICIDDTAIDDNIIKDLKNNRRSPEVTIIKYDV
jgi:Leucine-rich repeat (LRR) protein